jgi:hypothetical protein
MIGAVIVYGASAIYTTTIAQCALAIFARVSFAIRITTKPIGIRPIATLLLDTRVLWCAFVTIKAVLIHITFVTVIATWR